MSEQWFETATPESQGIPSSAILSFIEEIEKEKIGLDALIIMRHGKIVTEGYWAPFEKGDPHRLFSAGKAIVSTAILFAIDEGLLHLEDTVARLLADALPKHYSDKFDRMTVYDLLTMHTGHSEDTFGKMIQEGGDREKTFFSLVPEYEPGIHFLYNNGVPDILSIILYKMTEQRVYEYLENRLFQPLGMDGMNVDSYRYLDELPTMTASTRSLFKLAYFYANHGVWNGKQLLSRDLVDMAGSYLVPSLQKPEPPMVAYDTQFGYGFQIWRNSVGGFRIDGGRGQFGIVIPEMDLVAAMNATEQDQGVLPVLFWKHITNRMFAGPIKEDESFSRLSQKLGELTWAEKGNSDLNPFVAGSYEMKEKWFGTKSITLEVQDNQIFLATDITEGKAVALGVINDRQWHRAVMPFLPEKSDFGNGIGKNNVTGGNADITYACIVCNSPNKFVIHFRGKGFMGAQLFVFDFENNILTFMPYDDYARDLRSNTVKHKNLDACAVSQTRSEKLVKLG